MIGEGGAGLVLTCIHSWVQRSGSEMLLRSTGFYSTLIYYYLNCCCYWPRSPKVPRNVLLPSFLRRCCCCCCWCACRCIDLPIMAASSTTAVPRVLRLEPSSRQSQQSSPITASCSMLARIRFDCKLCFLRFRSSSLHKFHTPTENDLEQQRCFTSQHL